MNITVDEATSGERIDKVAAAAGGISRSQAVNLIEAGNVTVNGRPAGKNYRVCANDEIEITVPPPRELEVTAEDIPLDIMYEDGDLLVVNKPKGMVVHPAAGNRDGTLVNALLSHCGGSLSGINGVIRPGIVHRIDKNTSGLLIVAKNDNAHHKLSAQIKEHSFTRVYEAIIAGNLKNDTGTVDAPIGRHPAERKKMTVTQKNSKRAVTHYEVIERLDGYTHVRLRLETGRTHQIRVHMASIHHPVAGDNVYGLPKYGLGQGSQCLHARTIGFIHPSNGEYMEITSELPDYFKELLRKLRA